MFPSYLYCPPVSYPYFYPSIVFFSSLLSFGLISLFLSLYCLILTSIVLRSHIPISSPLLSSYYLYCPPVSNPYFYPSIVFLSLPLSCLPFILFPHLLFFSLFSISLSYILTLPHPLSLILFSNISLSLSLVCVKWVLTTMSGQHGRDIWEGI